MLVLSRKKNESIVIDGNITVTVVEVQRGKVRLGVIAPRKTPVHRQEVHDKIQAKEEASKAQDPAEAKA